MSIEVRCLNTKITPLVTAFICLFFSDPAISLDKEALERSLRSAERDMIDQFRDIQRKPVEVLDFLGIDVGMTVLDLYAAGGYYTVILSKAVGLRGKVYAQNTDRGLRFKEDRQEYTQAEALNAKIKDNHLLNVVQIIRPTSELGIAANSVDAVMLVQVLHDYYNGTPARAANILRTLLKLLKPGGVIGIIDHVGSENPQHNRRFHRMLPQQAIALAEEAGFILVGESSILRNNRDQHNRSVFDPILGRNTDRFLLKFIKPQ